jgi:hypothetical protein
MHADPLSRWKSMVDCIDKYLTRIDKKMVLINVEGGSFQNRNKAIQELEKQRNTKDIEPTLISMTTTDENGKPLELLRWVYFDIEFSDDPNAKIGMTGKTENIVKCLCLIGDNKVSLIPRE